MKNNFKRDVTVRFLAACDYVAENKNITTDVSLAEYLGINKQVLSDMRTAKSNSTIEHVSIFLTNHKIISARWIMTGEGTIEDLNYKNSSKENIFSIYRENIEQNTEEKQAEVKYILFRTEIESLKKEVEYLIQLIKSKEDTIATQSQLIKSQEYIISTLKTG